MVTKRKLLSGFLVVLLISVPLLGLIPFGDASRLQTVALNAIEDSRTRELYPTTNYCSENSSSFGYTSASGHMDFYIKFSIAALPPIFGTIVKAELLVNRQAGDANLSGLQVQLWSTADNWTENNLTWNNKPSLLNNYTDFVFPSAQWSSAYSIYQSLSLDVSDLQTALSTHQTNYTLALSSAGQGTYAYTSVGTKEGSMPPQLRLTFSTSGEGLRNSGQVAFLVDGTDDKGGQSDGAYYNFSNGLRRWADLWGLDYDIIDASKVELTQSLLSNYNLIVIGQFNLTKRSHITQAELQAINTTVAENGVGLIQVDCELNLYNALWSSYSSLFNLTDNGWIATTDKLNLTITTNNHYITKTFLTGEQLNAQYSGAGEFSYLRFENVTAGSSGTTLAVMPYNGVNYPALIVNTIGSGKTVFCAMATDDNGAMSGMTAKPYMTNASISGLLLHSIQWAAKKPFVMFGMPPFKNFRRDDQGAGSAVEDDNWFKLVNHGYGLDLSMEIDPTNAQGAGFIANLTKVYQENGQVIVNAHSLTGTTCLYYNFSGTSDYSTSTLNQMFSYIDGNFSAWNITLSSYYLGHQLGLGGNVESYVTSRGGKFTNGRYYITPNAIASGNYTTTSFMFADSAVASWIFAWANDNRTISFFSYANAMDKPSSSLQDVGEDWTYANATIANTIRYITAAAEHGLSAGMWDREYAHTQLDSITAANLTTILDAVDANLTRMVPFTISANAEYIAEYMMNRDRLSIENYTYSNGNLAFDVRGTSSFPCSFYVYTDSKISAQSGLTGYRNWWTDGYLCSIGSFANSKRISINLGATLSETPNLQTTTSNVSDALFSENSLLISARPLGQHADQKYFFNVDCGSQGEPSSIAANGNPITQYSYNATTRILSFNTSLSKATVITINYKQTPPSYNYVLSLAVSNPHKMTYTTSSIAVSLSSSGNDTNPIYNWNVKLPNATWLYVSNKTTAIDTITLNENSSNVLFCAKVSGDHGAMDYKEISFSVALPSPTYPVSITVTSPTPTIYNGNQEISINLSVTTNGTNPTTTWNIQFSDGAWLYAQNQTYTKPTTITIHELANKTCKFCVKSTNNELFSNYKEVQFQIKYIIVYTISLTALMPINVTYPWSSVAWSVGVAGNDTNASYQIQVYNAGNIAVFGSNQTASSGIITNLVSGGYTFCVSVEGFHGAKDYKTVTFTVLLPENNGGGFPGAFRFELSNTVDGSVS